MPKRMNMSIVGQSPKNALVDAIFWLEKDGQNIVLRAKVEDKEWYILKITDGGTMYRYFGLRGPFQTEQPCGSGSRIALDEED